MNIYELAPRFRALFDGLDSAFGTGEGKWIKRPPRTEDFIRHLQGEGPGLGIAPLRPDDTVKFAAIDLDSPDFELAREFQRWIPGVSFIERSRSGNAHVWVFFSEPCEAWVAAGILRYAVTSATNKPVEVFPKQTTFDRVRLGNYINLPYHGDQRPVLEWLEADHPENPTDEAGHALYKLDEFIWEAEHALNSPEDWRKRADWLLITDPALSRGEPSGEFGENPNLHICTSWIMDGVMEGTRPIAQGHRSVVYFNLAKQFANCSMWDFDEALEVLIDLRDRSDRDLGQPPKPTSELQRYLRNAYDKMYTSTGCDDPVFLPYAHPNCPIAHGRR